MKCSIQQEKDVWFITDDKVEQWLSSGLWFFPVTPVSYPNKLDCHDTTESNK
jgi:hypothetical protein